MDFVKKDTTERAEIRMREDWKSVDLIVNASHTLEIEIKIEDPDDLPRDHECAFGHLDAARVRWLIDKLQHWLDTGKLAGR